MLAVWISILTFVKYASNAIATIFWSQPIPIDAASIPSKLPHPNPSGGAIPFDIPLGKATNKQIQTFMIFRGNSGRESMQQVANCAAEYKGLLYEERSMKWIDDHFRLKLPNLKYPYVDRHWNGLSSMWIETAPHIRKMFLACMTVILEHCINGFVLPGLYLYTNEIYYYNIALYGEVVFMIYANVLIGASYYLGKDVTVEQMHPAVWPLLLLHHISAMILCIGCIMIGESVPKDLVCYVLLALLGLTSSLHYVGQILDFSPWAQPNAPYTRLCNHIFCLASQIFFRVVCWMKIVYMSVVHCMEMHGTGTTVTVTLILLLFTLFNMDFVKYHIKTTKGCWMKIQQDKLGKVC